MIDFIKNKSNVLLCVACLICIAVVGLAVAGAVINYSPVPFADMWNGAIGFVLSVDQGNYSAWWAQHNEHRILLSRFFFWLDIKLFGGVGVFLIVFNYLLVCCAVFMFLLIINKLNAVRKEGPLGGRFLLMLVITSLLFLWSQQGNLEWAFQCHFFLAQLLPLCALFWLAKSAESAKYSDFVIACLFGGASVWALANGIFILPLMIFCSVILGGGWKKTVCLVALTVVMIIAYYYSYYSPGGVGLSLKVIKDHPLDLLLYTILYLGGGAYYIAGQGEYGRVLAACAGLIITAFTMLAAWIQVSKQNKDPFVLALIFFIVYIAATAFGAGLGRLFYGVDQALSSRYTTPSNMAWAALLVVIWHERYLIYLNRFFPVVATLFMSCVLIFQLSALNSNRAVIGTREIAALAAALGVNDTSYIENIFPNTAYVLDTAKLAEKSNYSIYGKYPYKGLSEEIGRRYDVGQRPKCLGSLEGVVSLPGESDYVRVYGWLFDPSTKSSPKLIRFTGREGNVVGFAFTGGIRADVKSLVNHRAGISGFTGYILASQSGEPVVASSESPGCSKSFSVRSM